MRFARIAFALIAIATLMAAPASAQIKVNGVYKILPAGSTDLTVPTVMVSGTSWTSDAISVRDATTLGLSWHNVTASGAPSINVIILQANHVGDTFAQWNAPVDGTSPVTNVTITSVDGGSSLKLSPGALVKFQVLNSGTVNATPTLRGLVR